MRLVVCSPQNVPFDPDSSKYSRETLTSTPYCWDLLSGYAREEKAPALHKYSELIFQLSLASLMDPPLQDLYT